MFLKHKPKPPLVNAFHMVNEAVKIAHAYQQDRAYMPSEQELRQFDMLAETMFRNHSTVWHIARNMHQRAQGEPEGAKKFTRPNEV